MAGSSSVQDGGSWTKATASGEAGRGACEGEGRRSDRTRSPTGCWEQEEKQLSGLRGCCALSDPQGEAQPPP